ncbi:MAG: InlB B-repeat-containing protein, partial [Peptoanaerobacter stomatis]
MKRYKAKIFSMLMSICIATTFVGYNFTVADAIVRPLDNIHKFHKWDVIIFYINNIKGKGLDNVKVTDELNLIKGEKYTLDVSLVPEGNGRTDITDSEVFLDDKYKAKLSELSNGKWNVGKGFKKLSAKGSFEFIADNKGVDSSGNVKKVVRCQGRTKTLKKEFKLSNQLEYIINYKVIFKIDGSIVGQKIVKHNERVTELQGPGKEGYDIVWTKDGGESYDFDTKVTDNITLVGKHIPKEYTVEFETGTDEKVESQKVKYNEKSSKPKTIDKINARFSAWILPNGRAYDFSKTFEENIKHLDDNTKKLIHKKKELNLKAKYQDTVTVSFEDISGNRLANPLNIDKGSEVKLPVLEEKNNYTVKNWQIKNEENGELEGYKPSIVEKDLTLIGGYETPIRYYVCFVKDDSSHNEKNFKEITQEMNLNKKIIDKSEVDSLYGNIDTSKVSQDTKTLDVNKDNVKVLGKDADSLNEKATEIFKRLNQKPEWIEKQDYEVKMYRFVVEKDGFHVDMRLIGKDGQEIKPPAPQNHKVKFVSEYGNKVYEIKSVENGKTVARISDPDDEQEREFSEWQLDGKEYDFNTPVTEDITLVAVFKEKQSSGGGNSGGGTDPGQQDQGQNQGQNQGQDQGQN